MNVGKRDIIWSYLSRFFSIGINIILLPLIMKFLSDEELGLWYVFASISQVVNLFDFGFSATISRHMTYAWSGAEKLEKISLGENYGNEKNTHLMSEVMCTCRIIYFVISICALLFMATGGTIYIRQVVGSGMTGEIYASWMIYMIAVFLNLFYGYWTALLHGIGAVAERNKLGVYSKMIQMAFAVVLLLRGLGLLGFVIAYTLSGVSLRLLGKYYFKRKTERLGLENRISLHEVRACFGAMWGTAWRDGLVMVAQYLSTQANTLVCAYYIDLASTSMYGVITQIVSVIASVATAYFATYQPAYSSACLQRKREVQKEIICTSDCVYKIIFGLGMLALMIIGLPLLCMIRPGMVFDRKMIVAVGIFYYLYNQHGIFASMIASTNRIPYCSAYVVSALGSFMLAVFLAGQCNLGIWGLVLSQIVANVVYNNWRWPLFVMQENHISYLDIYRVGFGRLRKNVQIRI